MRALFFCFLCITYSLSAQQILPVQQDTSHFQHQVSFYGNGFYQSNTLQNSLVDKFLFGGYITDDIKRQSMKDMVSKNRIGSNVSAEFDYANFKVNLFGKKKWGMLFRAGYEMFNALQFSRGAFELGFLGNAQMPNNQVDFSNMHLNSVQFQKIGFGVIDKKSKSSIVLNFVNGSSFFRGTLNNGSFTQTSDYDTLSLGLKGNLSYNNFKQNFVNGQGFAIDGDFRIQINWGKTKKAYIQVMARNIGLVFFNKTTTNYALDTNYTYSGLGFKNLLSGKPLLSKDFSVMDTLNIHPNRKAKPIWLPGYIQVAKIVDRNNPAHWQPFFGINIYTSLICLPQLFAGVHYQPAPWFAAGASLSFGGFGLFRGGLYMDFRMKNVALGLATNDIYGLCTQRGFGRSAQIRLTWQIK